MESSHNAPINHAFNLAQKRFFQPVNSQNLVLYGVQSVLALKRSFDLAENLSEKDPQHCHISLFPLNIIDFFIKGASVACSVKHCTKMFHFPCGYINNHLFIFSDLFKACSMKVVVISPNVEISTYWF